MNILEYANNWLIEDQLNAELLNDIKCFIDKNLEFLDKDKEIYSTKGDNAEQYWIKRNGKKPFNYKSKEYEDIELRFKKEIYNRLKKASLLRTDDVELEQNGVWTVIGEEGTYHTIHTHNDSRIDGISIVLYLNVPEPKHKSNSTYFVFHTNPTSDYIKEGCNSIIHINPEVGKVLIFPLHIPHGTYPQTKGIRQTFNIDFDFVFNSKSSINYS
tara:strand:+ start:1177 stop:1818 length:642 start_codon:yes stop_codon:yes gene_type:complete